MPLVPWTDLGSVYHRLALGRVKLVGWGAGGSFKTAYSACPLRLAYLIDSDPVKWGTRMWGIEVRSPEALAAEDPTTTVVMIYSAFLFGVEILRQVDALGPFPVIFPDLPHKAENLSRVLREGLDTGGATKPQGTSRRGILVQGPCTAGITDTVVRFYAARYPGDRLVLSTWDTTPPELLEPLVPFVDRLVLLPVPSCPGPQNRNLQRRSTLAGLEALDTLGVDTVLKTRTDTLAAAPDLLRRAEDLGRRWPGGSFRQRRPLLISNRFTFKYLPYTMSDIVQAGDVADLHLYWSAPEDDRRFSPYTPEWRGRSFTAFARERGVPEIHFLSHFAAALGRDLAYTVEDHWAMLRDHFILMDEEWFGLFFPKYGLDDLGRFGTGRTPGAIADHALWQRLVAGFDLVDEARAVNPDDATFESIVAVPASLWTGLEG